ncbi:centrosomal protein of 162 kDa-like [Lineus longissimus]|uniref:centrosomal protein of 162 kDa-like n=1 Tax=Lineus longissimus TaxID=88925 RepID=UPI002B4DA2C4
MSKKKYNRRDMDDDFEAFLKDSVSTEDSDSSRVQKFLQKKKQEKEQPWWMKDEGRIADANLSGTGKSYLKKKPQPQERKTLAQKELPKESMEGTTMSRDSLDGTGGYGQKSGKNSNLTAMKKFDIPELSLGTSTSYTETGMQKGAGFDTMDELADKERFFRDLEQDADSTIDYGQMNKELDKSETIKTAGLQVGFKDSEELEDFEVEETDEDPRKPSMLSKVALLDSMDTTLGTTKLMNKDSRDTLDGQEPDEIQDQENHHNKDVTPYGTAAFKSGTGFMNTDTSMEYEALHRAYEEVGLSTLDQTEKDPYIKDSLQATNIRSTANMSGPGETEEGGSFGLKQVLPPDSDIAPKKGKQRNVDDILIEMEEIKRKAKAADDDGGSDGESRGFNLSPAPGLNQMRTGEDDAVRQHGFDLSPVRKAPPDDVDFGGDLNHSLEKSGDEDHLRERPVPALRKHINHHTDHKEVSPKKKKSKTRFSGIKSSGYGPGSKPGQKPPTKQKWSPADVAKQKIKGTEAPTKTSPKKKTPIKMQGGPRESQLLASVESFANYIQSHFTSPESMPKKSTKGPAGSYEVKFSMDEPSISSSIRGDRLTTIDREKALVDEVKEWQEQWKEERKMHAKVKADSFGMEREHKRKVEEIRLDYEQQLFKLKQENFVLAAKVTDTSAQQQLKKQLIEGTAELDKVTQEQMALLEKEIREQEGLIAGYQQENERLFTEMKRMQTMSKVTEDRMFKENQKLAAEIMNLRTLLERKEFELKNKGIITAPSVQQEIAAGTGTAILGAGKIAQQEAEIRQMKRREDDLKHKNRILEQAKRELEMHIEKLVKERETAEEKVQITRTYSHQEIRDVKIDYEKEIEKLNKKLKWYAENQELLDRDAQTIRKKNEEIEKLKEKIEELKSEPGQKRLESQVRMKERATEARKVQDLQRQVKELENILKKRHPNSLPALMWAASAAPETQTKSPTVEYLENRVKKLEDELSEQNEDGSKGIRVLEQKYNAMKFQYEERINELDEQLKQFTAPTEHYPHTHSVALQKELETVRERCRRKVAEKEIEVERLNKELTSLKNKASAAEKKEMQMLKESESELQLRLKALQLEFSNKHKEISLHKTTIESLKKEKDQIVIDSALHRERHLKGTQVVGKKGKKKSPKDGSIEQLHGKQYQPDAFKGLHISDVVRENDDLKVKVERLQLEIDQQRVDLQKALAEKESSLRRIQESFEDQISALKSAHKSAMSQLVTSHAMQHGASKIAELQSRVETLEVMVVHLKDQLYKAQMEVEHASVLKIREATLETQVKQLLEDLRDAKKSQTPEMRHFEGVLHKISLLESKHVHREGDLQSIINRNKQLATAEMEKEVAKWKQVVEMKNREIEKFRLELDSILEVLRELQRQGVILPSFSGLART